MGYVPSICIHTFDSNEDSKISLSSMEPEAFFEERVFEDPCELICLCF